MAAHLDGLWTVRRCHDGAGWLLVWHEPGGRGATLAWFELETVAVYVAVLHNAAFRSSMTDRDFDLPEAHRLEQLLESRGAEDSRADTNPTPGTDTDRDR